MTLERLDRSRWIEVQGVLDVALELAPDARDAYVDRVCRGDEALRRDVLTLLEADGDADGFLSIPVAPLVPGARTVAALESAAAQAAPALDTPPPERIGRYLVEDVIGRGGMGIVYRGTDPVRHRSVAIKALGAGRLPDPQALAHVLREAKVLAWLQHPNVAPIYGIEREAGVPYLVMERVEGQSLAERLGGGPLPVNETLDIALQVADALGAAHAAGVVHRDVKPGNVMITSGGLAKVLDFGVARHVTHGGDGPLPVEPGATRREPLTSRWGTPGYMSPEQILGLDIDARADAFSFGCIVYECLTGTCPFARDSVLARITATLGGDVDWTRLPADTPQLLRELLAALLRRDPDERPALAEVAPKLETLLEQLGGRTPATRAGAAATTRLPATAFELFGREHELDAVERLLAHSRIVTLTGPPGAGKTRLAIEVARRRDADLGGNVWFADLAPVTRASDAAAALRAALGADAAGTPSAAFAARLGDRPGLLVLDGGTALENLVTHTANSVLGSCPALRILTTYGHRIGLDGEQVFAIPPLEVPDAESHRSADAIAGCASIALLLAAGRRARPGLRLAPEHAAAAARIARAVDGLPLALELAGAMLRDDTFDGVASRLEQAASDASAAGGRLESLLGASHDGLLDDERALVADLSVFTGGWTLESALAVCGTDGDPFTMLDLLTRLVEKSFVVIEHGDRLEPRYRFLEPIRRHAVRVRETTRPTAELRRRHVDYFVALSERLSVDLARGRTDPRALAIFSAEHANMLEAIRCAERMDDAPRALALAGTLWRFWSIRGGPEARHILRHVLRLPGAAAPTRARASALFGAGALALYALDLTEAEQRTIEAMQVYDALGDRAGHGHALTLLGSIANDRGRPDEARARYRDAIALLREVGDGWRLTMALNNLGVVERESEDYRAALATYEETVAHARASGEIEGVAVTLINLALVTLRLGLRERAHGHLVEALTIVRDLGWKRMATAALEVAGELLTRLGDAGPAIELYATADDVRTAIGNTAGTWWGGWRDRTLQELEAAVGAPEFAARWASGRARSMDDALDLAKALLRPARA